MSLELIISLSVLFVGIAITTGMLVAGWFAPRA